MLFDDEPDVDETEFLDGSAANALKVDPGFSEYVFVEADQTRAAELQKLRARFPERAAAMSIVEGDANDYLLKFCRSTDWGQTRAVVFVDPYAMEVDWTTVDCMATTGGVDLWLLFPMSAVNRLLVRTGQIPDAWAAALTRLLGANDWRTEFYLPGTNTTLFGSETIAQKTADFASIANYFERRLRTVFPKVVVAPRPMCNSRNSPLFLLCFAAANPGKGGDIAVRIARSILEA